jgi:outer membrane protein TolC
MLLVRYSQTIPYLGKTERRQGVARHAAAAKGWELEEKRSQLKAVVEQVFYRLGLARQLEALTGDHVELVEQLIDVARFKYEVGSASQHDLLRLELLRDRLKDDLNDFERQEKELTAALNATLHRDTSTPIVTPEAFELPEPSMSLNALRALALAERAALRQLDTTAEMFRAAADLDRLEARPDPTLFASYGLRTDLPGANPGRDLVTVGISVPLPLFRDARYEARALESSSRARSAEAQRASLEDQIASGLADALATWERAAEKLATYDDRLVPQAQQVLDATFASYQVNRADFLALFEAELELLRFEKTMRIAAVEGLVARATIEMLVGKELQR